MLISAGINNSVGKNAIEVSTNQILKEINIPGKPQGYGSPVNGGELLFLALATCYCNDVYREAAKRNMKVDAVGTILQKYTTLCEKGAQVKLLR